MKPIKKLINGVDFINAVASAVIGLLLLTLISWLSKNHWESFYKFHTFSYSIARLTLIAIIVMIFVVIVSAYRTLFIKLEIISAKYGVTGRYVDVTPHVKEMVSGNKINFVLSNGITGGFDPAEQVPKHAIIVYRLGKKESKITVSERDRIILPNK